MGREANRDDFRPCNMCKEEIYGDAADLRKHAETCKRLQAIGLTSPDLVKPKEGLIVLP